MNAAILLMASAAMKDPNTVVFAIAKRLSITTATLYPYVNGDGSLKKSGFEGVKVREMNSYGI